MKAGVGIGEISTRVGVGIGAIHGYHDIRG